MFKRVAKSVVCVVVMSLLFGFTVGQTSFAKDKWVSLGVCRVSSYCPECNTPAGSRTTCTGAVATGNRTIAVDMHNPILPYGSKVKVEGCGDTVFIVEDCGGFGQWGKDFDMFFDTRAEECVWGQRDVEVWVLVPETEEEIQARKERKKARRYAKKRAKEDNNYLLFFLIYLY